MSSKKLPKESTALALVRKISKTAIDGAGPLTSARELAQEYKVDPTYDTLEDRVQALIRWEVMKNFSSGFLTGLGGMITLPIAIPAAIGASWIVQARMVAAIAALYGHDLRKDRVRTMVLLTLLGSSMNKVLQEAGVTTATRLSMAAIQQIPGKALIEINKQVGFRLMTKAGETGVVNLTKVVPIFGGILAGSVDATFCYKLGDVAVEAFRPARAAKRTKPLKKKTTARGAAFKRAA